MIWILISFSLCEFKISDINLRLPIYNYEEKSHPYQCITCFYPKDITLTPQYKDGIGIEYIEGDSTSSSFKVIIKYSDPQPIATEIIATNGIDSTKITVNIDRIDHLEILSTADSLYVNTIIPIKLNAFNEKGLIFSSLNGTILEWGSTDDPKDRSFDFIDIERSPLKGLYDPSHYILIKPKRAAITNITCKLLKRDAHMANQRFRFVDKIIFHPEDIYMLKGAEVDLHLYYAYVNSSDNEFYANLSRPIKQPTNLFEIKSYTPLIATVSQSGRVIAHDLGKTTITARDLSLLSNVANAIAHVVIPDKTYWEEQWIKTMDQNKGNDSIGPFEPNTSSIVFFYKNHSVFRPDKLALTLSDEWKNIGTHKINASIPNIGYNFMTTIHTCPPPKINSSQVRLPVGYNNCKFEIIGGSGYYDFEYDSSLLHVDFEPQINEHENGPNSFIFSVSSLKEGKAVITIIDKKFKGYYTTLTIVASFPYSISLVANDTELFIGEKFTKYTVFVYDKDHNLFDNILKIDIKSENLSILNEKLVGISPGFTHVYASFGSIVSNRTKILVKNSNNIDSNVDESISSVSHGKLHSVLILATDSNSINSPECNLLMSYVDDKSFMYSNDIIESNIAIIPYNHHLGLKLIGVDINGKYIGPYSDPSTEILLTNKNKETTKYTGSFRINNDLNITVHVKDNLKIVPLEVKVIHPHKINENDPILLYKNDLNGVDVHIINGNGPFVVVGEEIQFKDFRTIHISPFFRSPRRVLITDRCIPENNYSINIQTYTIGSIAILGPIQAIVGDLLNFKVELVTPDGKIFPSEFRDKVQWSIETPGLEYNNEKKSWEINATKPGELDIIIAADGIRKIHTVFVLDKVVPKNDYIVMFVGEKHCLEFEGSFNRKGIVARSSNTGIVSLENNLVVVSHKPGTIQVTLYLVDNPTIEIEAITINVLEAKNLILKYNKTDLREGNPLYVGSYVHIFPYIETNLGLHQPKTIKWTVDGSSNWIELYDHSIIIKGEKEGTVFIEASSINNLHSNVMIDFDYKLQLQDKDQINIPLGATYDVKTVDENMKDVQYQIISPNNNQVSGVSIDEKGRIYAGEEGQYIVIVRYKSQWQVIPLTITKPAKLYLQSDEGQIVRPRILDPYYQEYTAFRNYNITFNQKYVCVNNDGYYKFDVQNNQAVVESIVSVYPKNKINKEPLWRILHSNVLYEQKSFIQKIVHANNIRELLSIPLFLPIAIVSSIILLIVLFLIILSIVHAFCK